MLTIAELGGVSERKSRSLGTKLKPEKIEFWAFIQSGASSQAKIGGAYFSGVTGSIQDPIAVPGPCEVTEP